MSNIIDQASAPFKASSALMYGGSAFSVGQFVAEKANWFVDNVNWISATVGIFVAVAGFIWNRVDRARDRRLKEKENADHAATEALNRRLAQERHDLEMAILRGARSPAD